MGRWCEVPFLWGLLDNAQFLPIQDLLAKDDNDVRVDAVGLVVHEEKRDVELAVTPKV